MTYAKSAYHNPWPNGVPNSSASSRGWGAGWPKCQTSKMVTIVAADQTKGENYDIRVTVRKEIAAMVVDLLEATDKLYDIDQHDTGAYNCRPIAGTSTASNHSWGLAIDINWENNPQGSWTHSEIPPAVVAMWIDCGFGWGGFYRGLPDLMHFEYLGTVASVKANAKKAAAYNSGKPAPTPAPKPVTVPFPGASAFELGKSNAAVTQLGKWLIAAGFNKRHAGSSYTAGPTFSVYDKANVRDFQLSQAQLRSDPDGIPGPLTWSLLQAAAAKK